MGSGGGKSAEASTVRFAPYIEEHHSAFLDKVAEERAVVVDSSPYSGYTDIDIELAFFGSGYVISSFPSLWDMYGKFMAGLDVDVLFDEIFLDTTTGAIVTDLVSEQAVELSDDLEQVALPRFETGMRDINAVVSSTFVVGRALMESARTKALSKFDAELRYRLIPVAADRWKTHLEWNKSVIETYAQLIKFYFMSKMDTDNQNYEMAAKDALWPFTVLRYEGEALGALTGAKDIKDAAAATPAQKALGGALSGASAGAMVGGGAGAVIGGALGLAAGLL